MKYILLFISIMSCCFLGATEEKLKIEHIEEIQRINAWETPQDCTDEGYYPRLDCIVRLENGDWYTVYYRLGPYAEKEIAESTLKSMFFEVGDTLVIPNDPYEIKSWGLPQKVIYPDPNNKKKWELSPIVYITTSFYRGTLWSDSEKKEGVAIISGPCEPSFFNKANQIVTIKGVYKTFDVDVNFRTIHIWLVNFHDLHLDFHDLPIKHYSYLSTLNHHLINNGTIGEEKKLKFCGAYANINGQSSNSYENVPYFFLFKSENENPIHLRLYDSFLL